ncbi:junctional adhesion molecule-like [Astyanax mexicanus]|uniref:junctional adhesion molecule-like n=1 Tax=Astyanax mexicanus TaxID=7994 RepID=UPI0020CADC03|nr:junctional adhesion molecule-like [Astyanax mexicanus]
MALSKPYLWICLALCVAMGGCHVFYNKTGDVVSMDCGTADSNKALTWYHNNEQVISVKIGTTRAKTELGKKVKLIESTLKVPSLKTADSGTYKCTGQDGNRRVTREHTVYVMSASASPSETVLHSTDLTLTCDINNSPTAQIRWMNKNKNTYESPGKSISLKSVKSTDSGRWTCQIEDNKRVETLVVDIAVLGPLTSPAEVTVPAGGSADLTCSLPTVSLPHVETGGWSHDSPSGLKFPTLKGGQEWKGENNSRVMFNKEILKNDFKVTLNKVRHTDKGNYTCTVTFKNGQSLNTSVMLKVEVVKTTEGPKMNLWIWVGAAAALVLLIGLIIIIVLIHRRNKRMRRKVRKLRSVRQGLTPKNYCQCDRTDRQPHAGKRERPPPLPRYQYDIMD